MDFDDDDASVGSSFSSGDFPNDGDEGGFPSSTFLFNFSRISNELTCVVSFRRMIFLLLEDLLVYYFSLNASYLF